MSTLKPYPVYRDTGVEQLGQLPVAWERTKLKWECRLRAGGTPESTNDSFWLPGDHPEGIPFVAIGDMSQRDRVSSTEKSLSLQGFSQRNLPLGKPGTVLIAMYASVGEVSTLEIEATWNQALISIEPTSATLDGRFISYFLRSAKEDLLKDVRSNTQANLNAAQISDIWVPLPPSETQQSIADFLDRETAEIDEFVAESEKLITLLNERRAAVITQAVTKGLDPTAPMKDTGIEWLGRIPAHWGFQGMSPFVNTWSGAGFPDSEQGLLEEALPFYKVNALGQADSDGVIRAKWDTISIETAVRLRARIVPSDAMILAKIGAALLLGRVRRVEHECCIDNNMMAVVPKSESIDSRFLQWALQTISMELHVNPGAVPSLNVYSFIHHELALPPLDEQEMIATHLEAATAKIDQAIETAKEAIALAKERRQALISAAVTGKIDVRTVA